VGVDPVQVKRFRRWLIPGSALSLACLGVGLLALAELEAVRQRAAPERGATRRVGSPTHGRVAPRPSDGPTAARPLPAVARRQPAQAPLGTSNAQARPPQVHADPALAALWEARTLEERLRYVDEQLRGLQPDAAVALLSRLLDARLPGPVYEERSLRLTVLARVGTLPGPHSEAILVRSAEANRPRPERLIAIEFLSGRGGAADAVLQRLADSDDDSVVQQKARWALARGK